MEEKIKEDNKIIEKIKKENNEQIIKLELTEKNNIKLQGKYNNNENNIENMVDHIKKKNNDLQQKIDE